MNVVDLSITTEHQEVVKTGNTSKMLLRTSRDPFFNKKIHEVTNKRNGP